MKHLSTLCFRLSTLLVVLFLMAAGLPARAQQTEAMQQAAQLALQTRLQWAGADISATSFRISNAYTESTGLLYAYPQQLQGGIPVYNQVATLVFKAGVLRHHAGTFLSPVAFAGKPAAPTVAAATAVATALASTKAAATERPAATSAASGPEQQQTFSPAGVAHRPIEVRLVWATDKGSPRLAWNVNVDLLATPDWLNIRVDAATGQILGQDNWTVNEAAHYPATVPVHRSMAGASPARAPQVLRHPGSAKSTSAVASASYRVVPLPGERPDVTTPNTDTNPWLRAGTGNAAATYGWHSDGTTDYTYTRGNNVWAYKDTLDTDVPSLAYSTYSTSTSGSLIFNNIPDFTKVPTLGKNRRAAVTNLFYWNNLMHDVMYQYGFTEAAGNFQASNLNRGGLGGDYVHAEAQDGGGTSNANFSTPPDGTSGQMQMYLFSVPAKVNVTAPANAAASYNAIEGSFSLNNKLVLVGGVTGPVVYFDDANSNPTTHNACVASANSLTGKIALISSLTCTYIAKVKAAQTAGAIGVIVLRSAAGQPAVVMGGTDNTITIPAVMVSNADGITISNLVNSGLMVSIPGAGLDGDYDSGVMSHEYGHGISNRLTGGGTNTSCLYNAEQAGEGWSDYFGLMMTTDWTTTQTTDGTNARPIGTYVLGQSPTAAGIRRYPYSTNMTVNPLTYANMATSTEVHDIGEIWCATLWDMTWNIIQMQGSIEPNLYKSASTGGNTVALQLVMQGLKLQPCQPGFLDSRDAILAADSLLYNGRYHCAIWGAFARRGMGFSAREGSSNSAIDQTVAYDVPSVTLSKNTIPLVGNRFSIAIKANCECPAQQNTYTITDQLPTDLQYLSSSPVGTLSGRTVTFANQTFTAGQTRTYQIQAQTAASKGCAVTLPINDNRDANTAGGLTAASVTGSTTWAATTTAAHSGTASWLAPSSALSINTTLTSAAFTPGSSAVLSFYQYANLTFSGGYAYDGGLVAISTDNGTTWTDAAPYFLQNGYDATFLNNTIIPAAARSRACFSGHFYSPPTPDLFTQSQLDLSSFSGQSIRIRFQLLTNTTYKGTDYGFTGWYLDDVQVMTGCGGNQQVQLLASGNTSAITSYLTPTFLTPLAVPTISSFTPLSGPVGTGVTITGTNLSGATGVTFNGVAASVFASASPTQVTATVPTGATTGLLAVTTPGGTATSSTSFVVTTAPVVTTTTGATTFTPGAGTVAVDNGLTVNDADSPTLASATVSVTAGLQSGQDVLAFSNTSAATFGNIGSGTSSTGTLALTSSGATATLAQWQAALRALTFNNTSASPSTSTRTVAFVVNDGSLNSTAATKNISFAATTTIVSITANGPSPTSATTVSYTVTFANAVTGVMAYNFATITSNLTGFSVAPVTGSGTTYVVTVNTGTVTNPSFPSSVQIQLNNSVGVSPVVTNLGLYSPTYVIDRNAPAATLSSSTAASGSTTSTTPFAFSVMFSESITGFSASGIVVTNGSVTTNPTGSGSGPYTFGVTPTTAGTATTVAIAANAAQDAAANGSTASATYSLTYTAPVATATTWTGSVSQDWFTAGNWTAGVPTATVDATIPASLARYPLLTTGTATTRALLLSGGTLTQSGGTLDVRGSWTNSGLFSATGGTVSLGQTALTSILGSSSSRFWNLTVNASGVQLGTSAATQVQRVLTLTGNLTTQGNPFTLLSGSTGDALVVNSGGVVMGTATVQRYIDPSMNASLGYRHYSAPVSNTTVADLATTTSGGSFAPVVNPAYNSAASPTFVSPFPSVYGYDDSRLSLTNSLNSFDKGYVSPTALTDALTVGRGYTVNIGASELVDFQGTLTTGDRTLALTSTRPTYPTDGGWQLLGNPYPAPLDYSLIATSDRMGLEAALYVYSSTSQYAGQYRSYINNVGNPVLPMGQGFFVRVAAGLTSATLNFHDNQRLTVPNSTKFQRPAETRPLVQLTLQGAGSPLLDEATVYFENGATSGFDLTYDAEKLANATGLNLSTSLAGGRQLSIDGQPELGASQRVVPLAVGVPAPGVYSFTASQLLNLSAVPVYLRDLQLGTLTDLRQQPTYQFTISNASVLITSRFELVFSPQQVLATVSAALAQQVAVYPNPAHAAVAIELPAALARQPVTATLVDALGRTVRTQVLPAGLAAHSLSLHEMASGVYALRLTTEVGIVVKKLVVE